jgi:hypothetical protein
MRTHTKKERPNTNTHMHTYAGIDEANVKEEYFITRTLLQTLLQTFFYYRLYYRLFFLQTLLQTLA